MMTLKSGLEKVKVTTDYSFWDMNAFSAGRNNAENIRQVFDWDKLTDWLLENPKVENMYIGLNGDFSNTYAQIIKGGQMHFELSDQGYFSSTHCVPIFTIDMEDGFECWSWGNETEYKKRTFWPKHCIEKLRGKY